jgi:hypothetical protein
VSGAALQGRRHSRRLTRRMEAFAERPAAELLATTGKARKRVEENRGMASSGSPSRRELRYRPRRTP